MRTTHPSSLLAAAVIGLGAVIASPANALTIYFGDYKINFDNYDAGTQYSPTLVPAVKCGAAGPGAATAINVGLCDAAATVAGLPGSSTDAAGIFSIASVTDLSGANILYTRGTASIINGYTFGPYLTGIFGGIKDYYVENSGATTATRTTTAFGTGGTISIYNNAADYDITNGPSLGLDSGTYASISDTGSLFLSGVFAAGAAAAGEDASYFSQFNPFNLRGTGTGYLDFNGGSALGLFDTNSTVNANGGLNDASLDVVYRPTLPNGDPVGNGWLVYSTGQASGTFLAPEPGSLALAAVSLIGLGLFSRRRMSAG